MAFIMSFACLIPKEDVVYGWKKGVSQTFPTIFFFCFQIESCLLRCFLVPMFLNAAPMRFF